MKYPLNAYKPVEDSVVYQKYKDTLENQITVCSCCAWGLFRKCLPIILVLYLFEIIILDMLALVLHTASFRVLRIFRLIRLKGFFPDADDYDNDDESKSKDETQKESSDEHDGPMNFEILEIVSVLAALILSIMALGRVYQYFKNDTAITRMGLVKAINYILICEIIYGVINFII